jgi:hypothetical protein
MRCSLCLSERSLIPTRGVPATRNSPLRRGLSARRVDSNAARLESIPIRRPGIDALDRNELFLTRLETLADIFRKQHAHPVLGLLVAEAGKQGIVLSAAEDHELFAAFGRDKMGFHGSGFLAVHIAPVSDDEYLQGVGTLIENNAIISYAHPKCPSANQPSDISNATGSVSEQRSIKPLLHVRRQLSERSSRRGRKYECLAHADALSGPSVFDHARMVERCEA